MKFTQRFLLIFTLEIDSTKVTLENSLNSTRLILVSELTWFSSNQTTSKLSSLQKNAKTRRILSSLNAMQKRLTEVPEVKKQCSDIFRRRNTFINSGHYALQLRLE